MLKPIISFSLMTMAVLGQLTANTTSKWQSRPTESISNTDQHTACLVHQGPDMTLVQCPSQYELYQTPLLAKSKRGESMKNYGSTATVVGVHSSFEEGRTDRLTYLEAPSNLKEIWIEKNPVSGQKELQDRILLQLPTDNGD